MLNHLAHVLVAARNSNPHLLSMIKYPHLMELGTELLKWTLTESLVHDKNERRYKPVTQATKRL